MLTASRSAELETDSERLLAAALAESARRDVDAFGAFVMGHRPAAHHKKWLELAADTTVRKLLIIAPPESAKTTWIAIALVAWYIGNHPLSTNFIGSVSDAQAGKRAATIASMIESNPRYRAVFPHIVPDERNWRSSDYTVRDSRFRPGDWRAIRLRKGQPNDPTLMAAGVQSSAVIGSRFTGMVVLDDPHDQENSRTELQRKRIWEWFTMTLMTRLTGPDAALRVIMTRWHADDLAGRVMNGASDEWKIVHIPAIDGDGQSYWPEQHPIEKLRATQREVGIAMFRAVYQGDPRGISGEVFSPECIRTGWPEGFSPHTADKVVVTADLAITKKETGSYTAIMAAATDRDGNLVVLWVWRGRWAFGEQIARLNEACQWTYDQCGRLDEVDLENNQYMAAAVQQMLATTTWPVRGVHHGTDKVTRARGVEALAESGMLYLGNGEYVGDLIDEMLEFPRGHTDQVDVLSMAHAATREDRRVRIVRGNPFYV